MPIAAAIRTHRRRARPARQSAAARHRPSRLPATAIAPVTNTWSYNRRRLPTAETQAPDGTRSWSLSYGYNAQGQRTSETAPDNVTTTYTVNALGQTTQISVKVKTSTTTVASNASYYPNGALQQFTYGNGITHTLTQNARQLPQHSQDGSVLDLTTTFDENGNVAAIVDGTANARQSRSMTYDGLDRLTQVQSPMFGTASYGYDEQDNLRHVGISGGSQPRDHTYCYSADNRLEFVRSGPNCTGTASPAVIALGYDVQGNLQYKNGTAYTFDYGNRLRSTANQSYRYDAAGRRVRTDSAGSQLQYSDYASDGRLVWQRDEAAGKRINNVYLAGSLVAEVSRSLTTDAATYRYVHTDALGSPIAKTSSTGAVLETSEYEPYGALLNRANDDRAGYTGHVMDAASGLIYMQARYYDPGIGGFLSVDPVSATSVGGNFNRYWYANNNPYRFTDPDGRCPPESPCWWDVPGQVGKWFADLAPLSMDAAYGSYAAGRDALPDHYQKAGEFILVVQTAALPELGAGLALESRAISATTAAMRSEVAAKIITGTGEIRLSETAANSVANRNYVTPLSVRETIIGGTRTADPQGVAGRFMYTVDAAYKGAVGKFEVLVNEVDDVVEHAVFKRQK
ncbi:RHS repeat-associated core domain-containing protein [Thermomonas sp.]|uniref:RHS repeat-associated core domain-containing protein n=1 Tax=Thermomonas sp. TaxID=1971895 RepID=UPI00260AE123|nr:RHS repeat-associated core domain-containing protein [Thermomonas sp.]